MITIENISANSNSQRCSRGRGMKSEFTIALDALEVGQSFALPRAGLNENYLRNKISTYGRRVGRKFSARAQTEDGSEVMRFFRVS